MKIIHLSVGLTIKFRKLSLVRCPCRFRCVSLPFPCRPLPDRVRLGSAKRNFSTDSSADYENLLTREEVQEYLRFVNSERDKYVDDNSLENEILTCVDEVKNCENHLRSLKSITTNKDEELEKLVKHEEEEYRNKIKSNHVKILSLASPKDKYESAKGAIIEVTPGVGGIEARLFAEEVFQMYLKYIDFKGWNVDYVHSAPVENGGINKGEVSVSGENVFSFLKHEAGIHRVQRVPLTEKSGRTQTSTCRVHVLPDMVGNEIELKERDLKIETKLSSGPGGQNVQKTQSAVKITHIPTGITVQSQKERFQLANKKEALKKLKNILIQRELDKLESEESDLKRTQAATIIRSAKVRTYNFCQNRVTDHRISHTCHNLKIFMEGTSALNEMIKILDEAHKRESLLRNISRMVKEKNVDEIFRKRSAKS